MIFFARITSWALLGMKRKVKKGEMSTKVFSSHYSFISLSPGDLRSRQLLCDSPLFIVNTSTLIFSSWFNLLEMSCNRQLMMDGLTKGEDKHASSCERFRALRAGVRTKQSLCDMSCNQIWRQSVYGCSRLPHLDSELEKKKFISPQPLYSQHTHIHPNVRISNWK